MSRVSLPAAFALCACAAALSLAPALASPAASLKAATAILASSSVTESGAADAPAAGKNEAAGLASDASQPNADTFIRRIRGFLPDLRFSLEGAQGKTVTQDAFEGKVVLLFFGYASCPDICPTTMAQLSQVVNNLGKQADQVQIVFISVDPHRDTPDVLQSYVSAFNDHAIGLTGNERQIADVARRYRVAYQIEKPSGSDPKNYEVTHGRGIYIFDQKGRARFLASDSESIDTLTASVRELLG
ncbi:SCO family protein [Pusillimonas noertemannii]|uniref:Protein SCO1/2 n=1 Tax=Pusillimonas noertemannii TaxID=305977 RepID=A0A2U1CJW2_9BURK|nr:SCO family protein [Pusillimonas noertemannii]NYT69812.1 SCO family protein [Pusillimonas noertemannii]PVY61264.1 protein SCO1/2 [Pusillimonas noertemannii]TFL09113.1 SCO family protein [Pusillimonas noertemannii]